MTYVVSNLHGDYDKFTELLRTISFRDDDLMYVLGDLVDFGEQSMELIADLSVRLNVYCIAGEHDFRAAKLLTGFDKMLKNGGAPDGDYIAEMTAWVQDGGQTTLEGFRALGISNKVSFYRMSVNLTYYGAIERAYVATLGEDAREAIKALLDAEIAYSMYAYEESADALAEFNAKMATLTEKYAALDNAAAFDKALGDVYSYYLALYQA